MHLGVQQLPGVGKDPDPATIWDIKRVIFFSKIKFLEWDTIF